MVYLFNKNFKDQQKIRMALQGIYGIGPSLANQICDQLGFSQSTRVNQLSSSQIDQLVRIVNQYYFTGSELKRMVTQDIQRFISMSSYRGFRHILGLPVRGQRTKTNARTLRRKRGTK